MRVIVTTKAIDFADAKAAPVWAKMLRRVLPSANPDFDHQYIGVCKWWVEVDSSGVPQREIGLDAEGNAIVLAPLDENMGLWTDSPMVFDEERLEEVDGRLFESVWADFVANWRKEHSENGEA